MKFRHGEQGFSHVLLVILLAIAVAALAGLAAYRIRNDGGTGNQCVTKDTVRFCVSLPSKNIGYTETETLSATLTNTGDKTYGWSGSSSCSGAPSLLVNGRIADIRVCTQDITGFQLAPGHSDTKTLAIGGGDLKEGDNTVQAAWANLTSAKLTVKREKLTKSDAAKTERCFSDGSGASSYCTTIGVTIRNGYYSQGSNCQDLAKYFSSLDIKPVQKDCDTLAGAGILFFSVPKQDAHTWEAKLKAVPEVETARRTDDSTNTAN